MTKIRPLGDRVVVKPIEEAPKTAGGIILPDTAKEKPMRGQVMAVGDGKLSKEGKRIPLDVKVEDVVIYSKYSGTEFKLDGEDFLILRESDILAVVEPR